MEETVHWKHGLIVTLIFLASCTGVVGSYREVSNRDAEGLKTADPEMLASVYADQHKSYQWEELRRRGLVRDQYKPLIDLHQIRIGMTETELKASWGGFESCPSHTFLNPVLCGIYPVSRTITSSGVHVQWRDTEGSFVYTDNGIVTAIQQ